MKLNSILVNGKIDKGNSKPRRKHLSLSGTPLLLMDMYLPLATIAISLSKRFGHTSA